MNILITVVLPMLGSIFIFTCIFYGMWRMGTDRDANKHIIIAAILIYNIVGVLISLLGNIWLNLFILLFMPIIGNRIYHSGKKYFFYYMILVVAVYMTDCLISVLQQIFSYYGIIYYNSQELLILLHIAMTRVSEFMVICLIVLVVQRKHSRYKITGKQFLTSLILPVFSLVNVFTMLYCIQVYMTVHMLLLFLGNLVFLIGINIYFTVLLDTMGKNQQLMNELNLYQQQARMQYDYYESEEHKYDKSRKLIHDIKNHIEAMEQLYSNDAANDAREYAKSVHSMLDSFGQQYYTSHKLLNLILNDKIRRMQRKNIRADIKIGEVDISFIQDVDITSLFTNLLDNAIEAAEGGEEAWIKIRVNSVREFVSIMLENSAPKEPKRDRQGFITEKSGNGHGMGLKNVFRVVREHGGDMQCTWDAGVFCVKIMLVKEVS